MPNRGDRGGARTRERIAEVATALFCTKGFDEVTVADVAAAAGVSKVTVFAHFDRKEDLLLDRLPGATQMVRAVVTDRPSGVPAIEALQRFAHDLTDQRHPLSGLGGDDLEPFVRTVLAAPSLVARLREFGHRIEDGLREALENDPAFTGDAALTAAWLIASYRVVLRETVRRRIAGDDLTAVAADQRRQLDTAFAAVSAVADDEAGDEARATAQPKR